MTGALYVPEVLTPLAFTGLYADLSFEDRVAYNRFHGLYFLEQTVFFEQIMGRPALRQLAKLAPTPEIRKEALDFVDEEDTHTSWFRSLLREIDPDIYAARDFHLLGASPWLRGMMSFMARRIRWLPGLLWLQLMAEERALYFGRTFLAVANEIDARFLDVQKKHLADEPTHIRRDELFLRWLWPATPLWLRRMNAKWVRWMLREFFRLPKRSGWRVVERWLRDRPHLSSRRKEFRAAMQSLSTDHAFLRTLYPRRHLPRTAALAALWPEMAFMNSVLTD